MKRFPFPLTFRDQEAAIAAAAKELDALRRAWLNPPEWTREEISEFPGSVDGSWARYIREPNRFLLLADDRPNPIRMTSAICLYLAVRFLCHASIVLFGIFTCSLTLA